MTFIKLDEDKDNQIYDLLENLQQIEKFKNKDRCILLDNIVKKYEGKAVNK